MIPARHKTICTFYVALFVLFWPFGGQKIVICPLSTYPLVLNLSHDYGVDWFCHSTASIGLIEATWNIVVRVPSIVDPVVVHAKAVAPSLSTEECTGVYQIRMGSRTIVCRCDNYISERLHKPVAAYLLSSRCVDTI